jgi:trimeric autotransporter adhesin
MPGLTSAASKAAQGAPTHLVTSNAAGDLAAYTPAQLGLATTGDLAVLNNRIRQTTEGVALAMAMAGVPTLMPVESFAVTANWGTFEGEHGLAAGFALRIDKNVQFNGGIAYGPSENTVGGRAGIRIGW